MEQTVFCDLLLLKVWYQLSENIAAVEVLCIPFFCLFESRRLPLGLFICRHSGQRKLLFLKREPMVSLVNVCEQQVHRSAIDDDMMIVDKEIQMVCIAKQANAE